MIVRSCNVFSDAQVRSTVTRAAQPSMSRVYAALGCAAKCGGCARTIKMKSAAAQCGSVERANFSNCMRNAGGY
jgi:bacterioferritin-associated ferredoxin